MTRFLYMRIRGFGSISTKLKFRFDKPEAGLTVINGSNGVGKTTIWNALGWVCWGKLLKEKSSVETWEDCRPDSYKGTKVMLYYENNKGQTCCITRYKNFKPKGENTIKEGLSFTID